MLGLTVAILATGGDLEGFASWAIPATIVVSIGLKIVGDRVYAE